MLQKYGVKLGLKKLIHLQFSFAPKYLILPVNYWRNLEFKEVFEAANFKKSDVVLDIGSPKLLALYLSKKVGCQVFATDIEDYFLNEYRLLRDIEELNSDELVLQVEDGRNLSFKNEYFDKVFSISVLEHIPKKGDTECIKEIGRVLKRGGCCILTVPFSKQPETVYTSDKFYWANSSVTQDDGNVFFQRRYSEEQLYNRLIEPSGLKIKTKKYFGERILKNSSKELSEFIPKFTGPLQPLMSKCFHTEGVDSWEDLEKPLCALLVLEKK